MGNPVSDAVFMMLPTPITLIVWIVLQPRDAHLALAGHCENSVECY